VRADLRRARAAPFPSSADAQQPCASSGPFFLQAIQRKKIRPNVFFARFLLQKKARKDRQKAHPKDEQIQGEKQIGLRAPSKGAYRPIQHWGA
jgi:hypothetical protein